MRYSLLLTPTIALFSSASCVTKPAASVADRPPSAASATAVPDASAPTDSSRYFLRMRLDPAQFIFQDQDAERTTLLEHAKNRYLDIYMLTGTCSEDMVPKIGRITATTPGDLQSYEDLALQWFTQRSSVEHAPMLGAGFYICSRGKVIVVRYVGAEDNMVDAAPTLRQLLENRTIFIEHVQ